MEDMIWRIAGELASGFLLFVVGFLVNALRSKNKDRESMRRGLLAIIRNDLILIHNDAVKKGSISFTQAENAREMFRAYTDLGGNGVITDMMKELRDLPTETIGRRHEDTRAF